VLVVADLVGEPEGARPELGDPGLHPQRVDAEQHGPFVVDLMAGDHQAAEGLAALADRVGAEHLQPRVLEVFEDLAVVDMPQRIEVAETDVELEHVAVIPPRR
jgi:hypothetical protein